MKTPTDAEILVDIANYVAGQGDFCIQYADLCSFDHPETKEYKRAISEAKMFKAKAYCWSALLRRIARGVDGK